MKKLVFAFVLLAFSPHSAESRRGETNHESYVWICMGPKAYAYHSRRSCSGLNRCSCEIKKVTLAEAKRLGRGKRCGKCY